MVRLELGEIAAAAAVARGERAVEDAVETQRRTKSAYINFPGGVLGLKGLAGGRRQDRQNLGLKTAGDVDGSRRRRRRR